MEQDPPINAGRNLVNEQLGQRQIPLLQLLERILAQQRLALLDLCLPLHFKQCLHLVHEVLHWLRLLVGWVEH